MNTAVEFRSVSRHFGPPEKPVKAAAKTAANSSFGANMPLMSSAFDTAALAAAA